MKNKRSILVVTLLFLTVLLFSFVGCQKTDGKTKEVVLESVTETMVVMKVIEAEENASALSALTKLKEKGEIEFVAVDSTYGAYITSINGKAEQSSGTSGYSWSLYTSDTKNASTEYGSLEYNGKVYGMSAFGASSLLVKAGEYYIWVYEQWSY